MNATRIAPIALYQEVAERLRQRIFSHELPPGTWVDEQALAEHYGTVVMPARVRTPRDKAMAENAVRFGANKVIAVLRHRRFVGLADLNEAIGEQVAMLNAKPFQKRQVADQSVFDHLGQAGA